MLLKYLLECSSASTRRVIGWVMMTSSIIVKGQMRMKTLFFIKDAVPKKATKINFLDDF